MIPFFNLQDSNAEVAQDIRSAFERVFESGHVIMGPELEAFETEFAAYCGVKHCIGMGNGLDALALALRAKGIGPGDEVIVPSQTFIASWLAVSMVGATPVPVEIAEDSYGLRPDLIEEKISVRTKAIMPVHLFGCPVDMTAIGQIAKEANLFVLEDAAQAHGSTHNGIRAGGLGHAAGFSFYPTKNLGAIGDGGATVTSDDALAAELRRLRNYGSDVKYVHEVAGVNSRLDELQAAILRVKLRHLDNWNAQRRAIAAQYTAELEGVGDITLPATPEGSVPVYHLYVIRTAQREALIDYLKQRGITCLVHYPIPPHVQGAYANLSIPPDSLPAATRAANECLSLPIWPQMKPSDVATVVQHIRAFFDQAS